jgi:hypothetical protein
MNRYRVFVLGAGFSKPAGLPLCAELFDEIIKEAKRKNLYSNILKKDIDAFLEYLARTKGIKINENQINFEEFMSYLDVEHFLQLKGSDHWSAEGNKSQLVVRNLIALILHNAESSMTEKDFALYEKFVERLEPGDVILTFNYDTILEKAFSRKKVPYRLFPIRFKNVSFGSGEVLNTNEIVLLKMHGSINWFDISVYDDNQKALREQGIYVRPKHEVFAKQEEMFPLTKITNGPYPIDSPLHKIYMTSDIGKYLTNCSYVLAAPLIISPSYSKMVYLNPLTEFWRGYKHEGVGNGTVAIIGFSFPDHDAYIEQPLYYLVDNFQNNTYYSSILVKTNLKVVDYKQTQLEIDDYKKRYSFVDWNKADTYFKGFDEDSLDVIFEKP